MGSLGKSRFFREKTNKHLDEEEDYLPGQGAYVSPYAKAFSISDAPLLEASPDLEEGLDENAVVTYKRGENKYFTASRKDLPQFFIDARVQVRMTSTMGKGCFALEKIEKNTVVESAPVIFLHKDTFSNLNAYNGGTHKLSEYPFSWGREGLVAFSLGYGGIYNHRVHPNLSWRPNYQTDSLQYTAVRDIEAGEELFVRYVPLSRLGDLWFSDEESERYSAEHDFRHHKEDLGTMKSWKMFMPGDKSAKPRIE